MKIKLKTSGPDQEEVHVSSVQLLSFNGLMSDINVSGLKVENHVLVLLMFHLTKLVLGRLCSDKEEPVRYHNTFSRIVSVLSLLL